MQPSTYNLSRVSLARKANSLARLISVIACALAAACASVGNSLPPAEQVKQRAEERWKALVTGELSKAYTFNTTAYKALITVDGYRNQIRPGAVVWLGAEAVRVNCSDDKKCNVIIRIDYKYVLGSVGKGKLSTHIEETWLHEDGQWWFFQSV